jgi:hypothetical protein
MVRGPLAPPRVRVLIRPAAGREIGIVHRPSLAPQQAYRNYRLYGFPSLWAIKAGLCACVARRLAYRNYFFRKLGKKESSRRWPDAGLPGKILQELPHVQW